MTAVMPHSRVLVLNKNWRAIRFASIKRAMNLLFATHSDGKPKAEILDVEQNYSLFTWEDWSRLKPRDGDDVIRTFNRAFKLPEIIRLTTCEELPRQRINYNRKAIFRRDNYTCQYCGAKPSHDELTIEHIVPRSRGGPTTWENTCLACFMCNSQKADKLPEEARKENWPREKQKMWRGPSPMIRPHPSKPKTNVMKGDKVKMKDSWSKFISDAYWNVELVNDNQDD